MIREHAQELNRRWSKEEKQIRAYDFVISLLRFTVFWTIGDVTFSFTEVWAYGNGNVFLLCVFLGYWVWRLLGLVVDWETDLCCLIDYQCSYHDVGCSAGNCVLEAFIISVPIMTSVAVQGIACWKHSAKLGGPERSSNEDNMCHTISIWSCSQSLGEPHINANASSMNYLILFGIEMERHARNLLMTHLDKESRLLLKADRDLMHLSFQDIKLHLERISETLTEDGGMTGLNLVRTSFAAFLSSASRLTNARNGSPEIRNETPLYFRSA